MTEQLSQRSTLFMLVAMSLSIGVGLLAWGPIPLEPSLHHYADTRVFLGWPNGANALFCVPMLIASIVGCQQLRRSNWPSAMRRAWLGSLAAMGASSVAAAAYHLAPSDTGYLLAQTCACIAYLLLLAGFLAERVDSRCGSPWALALAVALALGAVAFAAGARWHSGVADLRPLLMLQVLPVLLIPAGALSLPGRCTTRQDWLLVLGLYAASRLLETVDAPLLRLSGWISGHGAMHLGLAVVCGWMAYRASAAPADTETSPTLGIAQAKTSLNTSG